MTVVGLSPGTPHLHIVCCALNSNCRQPCTATGRPAQHTSAACAHVSSGSRCTLRFLLQLKVESLAQLGVQLLLFHLGRELSFKKLRPVWGVALLGGTLQIVALMALGGLVAAAVRSDVMQVRTWTTQQTRLGLSLMLVITE